jgi:Zn-finger nucleic acid-binding protein
MKKVALGQPEIIIDACPEGHGLWFDGDEVTQLLKHLTKASEKQDSKQQVITFLGEVFKAEEPEK